MPNFIWASENLYWSNSKTGPSTIEEAKKRFGNRTLNLIEGIWFGDSLGTVSIIKDSQIKDDITEELTLLENTPVVIKKEDEIKYDIIQTIIRKVLDILMVK